MDLDILEATEVMDGSPGTGKFAVLHKSFYNEEMRKTWKYEILG
ncbi:hypothetical protein KIS4809_2116 [Bacillus sp. ZZV12-4809]|nr:hypothetical protein KIS4809_2116 [Bacillus sp. ZZV12-4809]